MLQLEVPGVRDATLNSSQIGTRGAAHGHGPEAGSKPRHDKSRWTSVRRTPTTGDAPPEQSHAAPHQRPGAWTLSIVHRQRKNQIRKEPHARDRITAQTGKAGGGMPLLYKQNDVIILQWSIAQVSA